jgi:hypothetical protein
VLEASALLVDDWEDVLEASALLVDGSWSVPSRTQPVSRTSAATLARTRLVLAARLGSRAEQRLSLTIA